MTPTKARRLLAATLTILAALASTPGSIGARTGPGPRSGVHPLKAHRRSSWSSLETMLFQPVSESANTSSG
jgi:hypothetical protein